MEGPGIDWGRCDPHKGGGGDQTSKFLKIGLFRRKTLIILDVGGFLSKSGKNQQNLARSKNDTTPSQPCLLLKSIPDRDTPGRIQ